MESQPFVGQFLPTYVAGLIINLPSPL